MKYQGIQFVKSQIATLPNTIGVYLFKSKDKVLYVGKSVNLKVRIKTHLENAKLNAKERAITTNSDSLDYLILDSEFQALVYETNLIKKYRPKYNSRWKDDKSYIYIKVTFADDYPKIFLTRRENDGKSSYFGPFSSSRAISEILGRIRRIYPYCSQKNISRNACFYSKIGLCNPCPNTIENLGDPAHKKKLKRAYRANMKHVGQILSGKSTAIFQSLYTQLRKNTESQNYEAAIVDRDRILKLENLLQYRFNSFDDESISNRSQSVENLRCLLSKHFPQLRQLRRIECYDISNLSFTNATASMVVFDRGMLDKSQYRKFKIKNPKSISDFAMLSEIFTRRFRNKWKRPDLLVVDGGKPQVRILQNVLRELDIATPFLGIAKNPDRLVLGDGQYSLVKPTIHNIGFNLIRLLRDEAHRFAKKYHLLLRRKRILL